MRKTYLRVLGTVTAILVVIGIFSRVAGVASLFAFREDSQRTETVSDYSEVTSLDIDLDACEVVVLSGDVEHVEIQYSGDDKLEPSVNQKGTTIHITQKSSGTFGFATDGGKLEITIPEDSVLDVVDADIDAGTLEVNDVQIQTLDAEVNAGDIEVNAVHMEQADLQVNAGGIKADNCYYDSLTAEVDMGDVRISGGSDLKDFRVDLSVDLGDIKVNGESYSKSYSQKGTSGDLTVEVDLGDIRIS